MMKIKGESVKALAQFFNLNNYEGTQAVLISMAYAAIWLTERNKTKEEALSIFSEILEQIK